VDKISVFLFPWRNFAAFLPPEMKRNIIVLQISCFFKKQLPKFGGKENLEKSLSQFVTAFSFGAVSHQF
jgi:hypothetical protein